MSLSLSIHGKGYPLVLFHGWGFDNSIWHPLIPMLERQYQLFLIDLPGFGGSADMEWPAFKANLLAKLPSSFAIAGWSMGGLYATRLAVEKPERVTHLLNIASSPRFVKEAGWPGITREVFATFYENLLNAPQVVLKQFIRLQLQGQHCPSVQIGKLPAAKALRAGLELLIHCDLRAELQQLKMPVGYLFGRLDAITSYKTMDHMQERYPQFSYILFPKAAHAPFLSHPKLFISALEEFIC
ncbi:alpha/beta fold hydrolase [Legionella septentrionalis]|uniref:alpha/beta fold hydrolase n=1 Tax=Legionella septentrionalis TaxID=2498109 RepID=UPI000F8D9E49|nr:alpha/beta fold hydrolase [Legionella septentrionalis]RUR16133.1 alpha/beta fold hydrolase [Legionella septentrionalis]